MRDLYMKDGQVFVLVYSIIAQSTFSDLRDIVEQLRRVRDTDKVPIIVVGNKVDLEDQRVITFEQGREFASSIDAYAFGETSAKTNKLVTPAFHACAGAYTASALSPRRPPPPPSMWSRLYTWSDKNKKLKAANNSPHEQALEAARTARVANVAAEFRPAAVRTLETSVFADLARLFNPAEGSDPLVDCEVVLGDYVVPCHCCVLALRSPYFRTLFDSPSGRHAPDKRGDVIRVRLPDSMWSKEALLALLRYVYRPYDLSSLEPQLRAEVDRLNQEVFGVGRGNETTFDANKVAALPTNASALLSSAAVERELR